MTNFLKLLFSSLALAGCFSTNLFAAEDLMLYDDYEAGEAEDYWRPYLDAPHTTYWEVEGGYVLPANNTATNWDDVAIVEMSAWGSLFYAENDLGADFEAKAIWDMLILQNFDGVGSGYPLNMARISMLYQQRFINGWGMRLNVDPGMYAVLEGFGGDGLSVPFGLAGTYALSENLSTIFGFNIYPGFDHVFDPRLGVKWLNGDTFSADVGYPQSEIHVSPYHGLSIDFGLRFWLFPEFQMEDDDIRERLMYDETRIYGGVTLASSEYIQWKFQLGLTMNREIDFDKNAEAVDLDDSFFFRVGVGGLL